MDARATTHGKAARAATTTHPAAGAGDACRRSQGATIRAGDVPPPPEAKGSAMDTEATGQGNGTPPKLYCHRCGHTWTPRTGGTPPRQCPACNSPNWNAPASSCICHTCGHVWTARAAHLPKQCPACNSRTWARGFLLQMRDEPLATFRDDNKHRIEGIEKDRRKKRRERAKARRRRRAAE